MHDIHSPINIIDNRVATSNELLGKECRSCLRVLSYKFFDKDHSFIDGRRTQCIDCESQPRLSVSEHTSRLREMNFNSHAVRKQRFVNQLDYMDDEARDVNRMHSSEFIRRLYNIISPEKLFLTDGNFIGDISVYRISGVPRPDFEGPRSDFKYLWYISKGWMPEFSIYEFDERAVPVREHKRGWRTPLLRLVKKNIVTEDQVNWEFGHAEGEGSTVYQRELFTYRNRNLN